MKRALFVLGVMSLFGCPDETQLTCDKSPTPVTLANDVQPLLTAKCATAGCHDPDYAKSYGDYSTAQKSAAMVGKKSFFAGRNATLKVVDPNALKNSSLWLKVLGGKLAGYSGPNGENVQDGMPYDEEPLSESELKLLKDWICTGAK